MNDGGAAFPECFGREFYEVKPAPGMSLRDYFAGQALIAIANLYNSGNPKWDYAERARSAYAQADAMLAARDAPITNSPAA